MKNKFILAVLLLALSGCAAFMPVPVETISKFPVVRVGDTPPANSEYVVFYPVGYSFPVKVKTSGSLFSTEKQIESQVTFSKNLYLYKYWASHDQVTWKNSHELLAVEFGGGFDVGGLQVDVKLAAK
jgi:hypothetical protein